MTTVSQLPSTSGLTHASSVSGPLVSSESASGTVTQSLTPSKFRAPPKRPAVVQAAPETVPVLPLPDLSATVVPVPSSKPQAPTRPLGGGVEPFDTLTCTADEGTVLPAASLAPAVSEYLPLATAVVSHRTEYGAVVSAEPMFAVPCLNW